MNSINLIDKAFRELLPVGFSEKQPEAGTRKAAKSKSAKPEAQKTRAQEMFQGQLHPKKLGKIAILDQWNEITIEDGKTVTRQYPSNELLIKRGQKMLPPPSYVYRRLYFVQEVPPEYYWSTDSPERRKNGGFSTQRMTIDTWLQCIDREALRGDGHIGVTGVGNMPRPKERGGCSCEVCTGNAKFFPGV
jgi:hypothetical protein